MLPWAPPQNSENLAENAPSAVRITSVFSLNPTLNRNSFPNSPWSWHSNSWQTLFVRLKADCMSAATQYNGICFSIESLVSVSLVTGHCRNETPFEKPHWFLTLCGSTTLVHWSSTSLWMNLWMRQPTWILLISMMLKYGGKTSGDGENLNFENSGF